MLTKDNMYVIINYQIENSIYHIVIIGIIMVCGMANNWSLSPQSSLLQKIKLTGFGRTHVRFWTNVK